MVSPIKTLLVCLIFLMPVRVAFAFETFNDDILSNLFFWLKPACNESPNLSLVSKQWNKIFNDDSLWAKFFEQDFDTSTRLLKNESESIKTYYFRLKKETLVVADVLAMKSWPQKKMIQLLTSDESDKVEIALSHYLLRAVLKEASILDVDSPIKLESIFYAYYETIADLVGELHAMSKNITEAIVREKNNDVACIMAVELMNDYLDSEGPWAHAANGIRNAAYKGYTNEKPDDFFCRVGEYIRNQIVNSGFHDNGHAAIKKRFSDDEISFQALSKQPPGKIGIAIAKAVSFYWLASLAQPDYLSTYFKGAYFFALKDAEKILKNIKQEFPQTLFLKEEVIKNIKQTAWPVKLVDNPHAQSFRVLMETLADFKEDDARDREK